MSRNKVLHKDTRYVILPGWVRPQADGEYHYVTAQKLANLYGVPIRARNVVVVTEDNERGFRRQNNDIYLCPKQDGDYTLKD